MRGPTIIKEILIHLLILAPVLVVYVLLRQVIDPMSLALLIVGGVIGTFLPDIDHIIYTMYLRPNELTSQRVRSKIATRNVGEATSLLFATTGERDGLIFHTAFFQCLFVLVAFLVVSSSPSLFGRGLVIAFLISLWADQLLDYLGKKEFSHWFRNIPLRVTPITFRNYILLQGLIILLLAYIF